MRDKIELHEKKPFTEKKGNKNIANQVVQYVMSVPDEEFSDLSASTIAHSFKMERTKLSRLFKRQRGIALVDFLHKEKMERAAFLLQALDITVKEVSLRIGFCSCDYFIKKFKEFYGIRPGSYKTCKTGIPMPGYRFDSRREEGEIYSFRMKENEL